MIFRKWPPAFFWYGEARRMYNNVIMKRKAVVCGGGGFIGHRLVRDLRRCGCWVRAVDLKKPEFSKSEADEFVVGDLRNAKVAERAVVGADEVYQLAADMGGMGYIDSRHDADIMHNSMLINLNVLEALRSSPRTRIFYSSSACVYPERNQTDPDSPKCVEGTEYPAAPDTDYGWEKLFSERLYAAYARDYGTQVRIGRFHNIFGPECTWVGGREKAPAALCRKIAEAEEGSVVEVWGDGRQTRSFLFIDECLEGVRRLMESDFSGPVNIGSGEMVAINELTLLIAEVAGKRVTIKNIPGPQGVRGRSSDNRLVRETLGWQPGGSLREGLAVTYRWVASQTRARQLSGDRVLSR